MTTTTYLSTRPKEHPERATIVKFADDLDPSKLTAVGALLLQDFCTANTAYDTANSSNRKATAIADTAIDTQHTASAAFGVSFDRWTGSIDDANGKGFAEKELPQHLGDQSFSTFKVNSGRDKVTAMTSLFRYVADTPALVGNPNRLKEVTAATTVLDTAVTATEAALRTRATAVASYVVATRAFDKAWGSVVKRIKDTDPVLAATLPRFRRVRGKDDPAETAPTPEPTPPTDPPADPAAS